MIAAAFFSIYALVCALMGLVLLEEAFPALNAGYYGFLVLGLGLPVLWGTTFWWLTRKRSATK